MLLLPLLLLPLELRSLEPRDEIGKDTQNCRTTVS